MFVRIKGKHIAKLVLHWMKTSCVIIDFKSILYITDNKKDVVNLARAVFEGTPI